MNKKGSMTRMLFIILLSAMSFQGIAGTDGEKEYMISPEELFRLGIENSLRIKSDRIDEKVYADRKKSAETAIYPDIGISLEGAYLGQPVLFRRGLTDPEYPEATHWLQNYGVTFNQLLYNGGAVRSNISRSDIEMQIARLTTAYDISEVKLELLKYYMNLICMYKQREVFERNIEESERRLEDITRMKREGIVTENDVLRSKMKLTDDRLSLNETNNSIRLVSRQLDIWTGLDENTILVPDTTMLSMKDDILTFEEYLALACEKGHRILISKDRSKAAETQVKEARSGILPKISMYASNTLARPVTGSSENVFVNNWNVGLTLSYPVSSLYKANHSIKEKQELLSKMENEEELILQQVRMELEETLTRHNESMERVEALKITVSQAEENYRIMRNRYMNQLAILTDLMDANAILLDAELRLTSARADVIYYSYMLRHLCGML